MFEINPGTVAIMIPIVFLLAALAIVITAIIMDGRQKELKHRERLIAMEKGLPIPELPKIEKRPAHLTLRAWGFVLAAVGLAVTIGITAEAGFVHGVWGFVPLFVGIVLLFAARLERKETPLNE